jgi:hypothetical protein
MNALERCADVSKPFPYGFFWLQRKGSPIPARVRTLLNILSKKTEAAVVEVESFDEILQDISRIFPDIYEQTRQHQENVKAWVTTPPKPSQNGGWPILRLNALPILTYPTFARCIVCDIGGWKDVASVVESHSGDLIFGRTRSGVLLFGSNQEVRRCFKDKNIRDFGFYTIHDSALQKDTSERGFLRDALMFTLKANIGLQGNRRRNVYELYPKDPNDAKWGALSRVCGGSISGIADSDGRVSWCEGVEVTLDWADNRLVVLFRPKIVCFFDRTDRECKNIVSSFVRERTFKRYNRTLNTLLDFWASALSNNGEQFCAFNLTEGVDATFKISPVTAFSRRVKS